MRYVSTRGHAPPVTFDDALLQGLAPDGGLYLPERWPRLASVDPARGYAAAAVGVLEPFVEGSVLADDLDELVRDAYGSFRHPEVAPLRTLPDGTRLLELFWGPTLSFKDYALQLVGRMFDRVLTARGRRMLVLGATSGDTGSAAIEACRDREAIDIVILYPEGRVSEVQRRQMTTVTSPNVHAVAVEGTFDDCQALVKAMFSDAEARDELGLGAVNSINWARVAAQTVYYAWAAALLAEDPAPTVAVPTGNFGNVYAAHGAASMGARLGSLVVANNRNHGLAQLITTGTLRVGPVHPTPAPAMDIQIPSNLERYLFELFGRDGTRVDRTMATFRATGSLRLDPEHHAILRRRFRAGWIDDAGISEAMARAYREMEVVFDPHTAVGWEVGRRHGDPDVPLLTVATAHPAKFPDAVEEATGERPELPADLADLYERAERVTTIPADPGRLLGLLRRVAAPSG